MKIRSYKLGERGIRIAHLADLHNRPWEGILAQVKAQAPDLIALAGDVSSGFEGCDRVAGFLEACGSLAPTWFSLGNHDSLENEGFARIVAGAPVTLLDDAYADVTVRGVQLRIGGLTPPSRHPILMKGEEEKTYHRGLDTAWLEEFCATQDYKILLCHRPEFYLPVPAGPPHRSDPGRPCPLGPVADPLHGAGRFCPPARDSCRSSPAAWWMGGWSSPGA